MKLRCLLLVHVLVLGLSGATAWAHDNGMAFADWMKSLRQPDFPLSSCCGPGDQYFVREYCDLSPGSHPDGGRAGWPFEPCRLDVATGRGA